MDRRTKYPETTTFHFYNANPKNRLNTGDCVIRAIAAASGKSWDDVLDGLVEIAHEQKTSVCGDDTIEAYLERIGFEKKPQLKKSNGKWFSGKDLCRFLDKSDGTPKTVVARTANHVMCIKMFGKRYKVWDTWDSTSCKMGNFWVKTL